MAAEGRASPRGSLCKAGRGQWDLPPRRSGCREFAARTSGGAQQCRGTQDEPQSDSHPSQPGSVHASRAHGMAPSPSLSYVVIPWVSGPSARILQLDFSAWGFLIGSVVWVRPQQGAEGQSGHRWVKVLAGRCGWVGPCPVQAQTLPWSQPTLARGGCLGKDQPSGRLGNCGEDCVSPAADPPPGRVCALGVSLQMGPLETGTVGHSKRDDRQAT